MNTNTPLYYGLKSHAHAVEMAIRVCDVLGHGKHKNAVNMLLETACAETDLGLYEDPTPEYAGAGLTQADHIAVIDVAQRSRPEIAQAVWDTLSIDLYALTQKQLRHNVLAAFVFTRCFYRLIPSPFPTTLKGRADYWKRHYNTRMGKGTPDKYIDKSMTYLYGPDGALLANENYNTKDVL